MRTFHLPTFYEFVENAVGNVDRSFVPGAFVDGRTSDVRPHCILTYHHSYPLGGVKTDTKTMY